MSQPTEKPKKPGKTFYSKDNGNRAVVVANKTTSTLRVKFNGKPNN